MMRFQYPISVVVFCLLCLLSANSAQAVDVTLAWDPNTEQDLQGYGIYFSDGTQGRSYQLIGYVALSEFDSTESPTFTVTGLAEGREYALAVTAYDSTGNESDYSEPVCLEAGVGQIECAASSTTAGGSSSGGGGGGGGAACFLDTVAAAANPAWVHILGVLTLGAIWRRGR